MAVGAATGPTVAGKAYVTTGSDRLDDWHEADPLAPRRAPPCRGAPLPFVAHPPSPGLVRARAPIRRRARVRHAGGLCHPHALIRVLLSYTRDRRRASQVATASDELWRVEATAPGSRGAGCAFEEPANCLVRTILLPVSCGPGSRQSAPPRRRPKPFNAATRAPRLRGSLSTKRGPCSATCFNCLARTGRISAQIS